MTQTVQHVRHASYTAFSATWKKCRDVYSGEDVVKNNGVTYLPKLDRQTDAQYDAYVARSRFYNAFRKTVKGHVGLGLRKPVIIEASDSMDEINNNIDRQGSDVRAHIRSAVEQVLVSGRAGTLVDFTTVDSSATMADIKNDRPYWVLYNAEDILDWDYEDGNITRLVLREFRQTSEAFATEDDRYLYRVCKIEEGRYIQEVYIGMDTVPEVKEILVQGKSINFIPFAFHQASFGDGIGEPPLLDLANLCLSHYRLKADHMHALHFVALPTPYVTGVDVDSAPTQIGPEAMWAITNPDAKVGMLEFTGNGVGAIKEELVSMEDQMAILGSRILLPDLAENTATAAKLRSMSETSDLATIIIIQTMQFNRLYAFTALWAGSSDETLITLDTNFLPKEMDPQMLTAMVGAWQASVFDRDVLNDNLLKAEIISAETDVDEMLRNIEQEDEDRIVKAAEAMKRVAGDEDTDDDDDDDDDEGDD